MLAELEKPKNPLSHSRESAYSVKWRLRARNASNLSEARIQEMVCLDALFKRGYGKFGRISNGKSASVYERGGVGTIGSLLLLPSSRDLLRHEHQRFAIARRHARYGLS
jgi:hypothetical protein